MADTDYKPTLNLPQTDFPMKANLAQLEPRLLEQWSKIDLYGKLMALNANKPRFIFHDGPPYANGALHHGHFLNKILKDIVCKYHNLNGQLCDFVPGWDCHGLPIELGVEKELGNKKREMDKAELRKAYRAFAEKWINVQRDQFKRLGVFGRWNDPYLTMSFDYEAQTVRELANFVRKGTLYRGKKPVYWCFTDRTALAEAEVEYAEQTSPTIYVAFPAVSDLGKAIPALAGKKASFVIWTTTPWTLPANLAISVHPEFTYLAYDLKGRVVIVAKELLAKFLSDVAPDELAVKDVKLPGPDEKSTFSAAALKDPSKILGYCEGKALENLKYKHPLFPRESPIVLGEHVTLEAGTGLVHTAPGHGMDDYFVGQRYKLDILVPVDAAGKLTAEAGEWAGLKVFDANPKIVEKLVEVGALLSDPKASFKHQYPHCWRCKKPVIFRATDQWFLSMDNTGLRKACLEAIEGVEWIPKWGRDRIFGMLENRPDWCVSRQRTWGVPITVLFCEGCEEPLLDPAMMDRVAGFMDKEGADAWYSHPVSDFLAPGQKCAKCGKTEFRRETDILDVWFDSGVSYAAVAENAKHWPTLGTPVDLYLEGSDQHRGWFHSSLMCSVGTRGRSPYKACLTHGMVVDGKGEKYSKSNPNYEDPQETLKRHGVEIVRMWVAASDYRDDIRFSEEILRNLAEAYRKIRNTFRYALSNLKDFDPQKDRVADEKLLPLDRWALAKFEEVTRRIFEAYATYEFHLVHHAALEFCATTLSATYFDVLKDRLYTFRSSGLERRSAQTVMYRITYDLLRLLAPILSFTAEEVWSFLPGQKPESVFLAGLPTKPAARDARADELVKEFDELLGARASFSSSLEQFRGKKNATIDAVLRIPQKAKTPVLEKHFGLLPELFTVSQVEWASGGTNDWVVEHADGKQCPRCRRWVKDDALSSGVCKRCEGQKPWP